MTARRYVLGLVTGTALVMALVAVTNRLVDPFWYYRDIEIEGFNALKPRFARFERHIKPQLLARERPQAVVLGSSVAEIGFDANDPALVDANRLKSYNFAFAGAGWDLVQCHFEYALQAARIERAVIGIAPGALPAVDCAQRLPEVAEFSEVKLLLSLQALNNSIRTVLEQRRGRSSHTRHGRYLYARDMPGVASRFREVLLARVRRDPGCPLDHALAQPPSALPLQEIAPAPLDLSGLRRVIRSAQARGVELRIFSYPYHALAVERDVLCGRHPARWHALAAIAQAIADEAPRGGVELWEFFPYNNVMGERVGKGEPKYWQDPLHFNHELGRLMLADMFGGRVRGKLGRRIVAGEVPVAYREFLASRERFLAERPEFHGELRALIAPTR